MCISQQEKEFILDENPFNSDEELELNEENAQDEDQGVQIDATVKILSNEENNPQFDKEFAEGQSDSNDSEDLKSPFISIDTEFTDKGF